MNVDQIILGAVQEGVCAELGSTNPYKPEDKKQHAGWEQGHKRAIEDHRQREKYTSLSWFRKAKCKIGLHRYNLSKIPGRPHINPKTGDIDRRDPIIEKYTCVYCGDVYFIGLDGGSRERQARQKRFRERMGYKGRRNKQ